MSFNSKIITLYIYLSISVASFNLESSSFFHVFDIVAEHSSFILYDVPQLCLWTIIEMMSLSVAYHEIYYLFAPLLLI